MGQKGTDTENCKVFRLQIFGFHLSLNKKALGIIAALFIPTTIGSGLTFRGPIIAWFVTPAIESKAAQIQATIIPSERMRTDSVISEAVKPISRKMDRVQAVIEEMDEGKAAIKRLKRKKDSRISLDSL